LRKASTKEGKRSRSDFSKKLKDDLELNIRFWLSKNKNILVAQGRVNLLENVGKYGSISMAAKKMNISYRHAWLLLDSIRKVSGRKIIKTKIGGVKGGGAELTPYAKKLIERFYSVKDMLYRGLVFVK